MKNQTPYQKDGRFLVSIVHASTDLKETVKRAVDLIGGLEKVIRPDDVVTIKPNLNTSDPYPASSDPEFIKTIGELVLDAGASKIKIMESSMFRASTRQVAEDANLISIVDDLDAELILLDEHKWMKVTIPRGKYLRSVSIGEPIKDMGKLIVAPCLKTHFLARYTGSMKIFVGWMRPKDRMRLHMRNLEPKIADLASYFNPDLIVMDARTCFVTGGPASGECSNQNLVLASGDMVSIDVEGVKILQSCNAQNKLGMDVWEIPQIKRAVELGIGAKGDNDIQIVEE